jgi:hypothetical protein
VPVSIDQHQKSYSKSRPVGSRSRSCALEPSTSCRKRASRWGSSHTASSPSLFTRPIAVHAVRHRPRTSSLSPRHVAQDEKGVQATGQDEEEVEPKRRKEHSSHRRTPTHVRRLEPPLVGTVKEGRSCGGRMCADVSSWSKVVRGARPHHCGDESVEECMRHGPVCCS